MSKKRDKSTLNSQKSKNNNESADLEKRANQTIENIKMLIGQYMMEGKSIVAEHSELEEKNKSLFKKQEIIESLYKQKKLSDDDHKTRIKNLSTEQENLKHQQQLFKGKLESYSSLFQSITKLYKDLNEINIKDEKRLQDLLTYTTDLVVMHHRQIKKLSSGQTKWVTAQWVMNREYEIFFLQALKQFKNWNQQTREKYLASYDPTHTIFHALNILLQGYRFVQIDEKDNIDFKNSGYRHKEIVNDVDQCLEGIHNKLLPFVFKLELAMSFLVLADKNKNKDSRKFLHQMSKYFRDGLLAVPAQTQLLIIASNLDLGSKKETACFTIASLASDKPNATIQSIDSYLIGSVIKRLCQIGNSTIDLNRDSREIIEEIEKWFEWSNYLIGQIENSDRLIKNSSEKTQALIKQMSQRGVPLTPMSEKWKSTFSKSLSDPAKEFYKLLYNSAEKEPDLNKKKLLLEKAEFYLRKALLDSAELNENKESANLSPEYAELQYNFGKKLFEISEDLKQTDEKKQMRANAESWLKEAIKNGNPNAPHDWKNILDKNLNEEPSPKKKGQLVNDFLSPCEKLAEINKAAKYIFQSVYSEQKNNDTQFQSKIYEQSALQFLLEIKGQNDSQDSNISDNNVIVKLNINKNFFEEELRQEKDPQARENLVQKFLSEVEKIASDTNHQDAYYILGEKYYELYWQNLKLMNFKEANEFLEKAKNCLAIAAAQNHKLAQILSPMIFADIALAKNSVDLAIVIFNSIKINDQQENKETTKQEAPKEIADKFFISALNIYYRLPNKNDGQNHYQQGLDLCEKFLEENKNNNHPLFLDISLIAANLEVKLGNYSKAMGKYNKIIESLKNSNLPEKNLYLLMIYNNKNYIQQKIKKNLADEDLGVFNKIKKELQNQLLTNPDQQLANIMDIMALNEIEYDLNQNKNHFHCRNSLIEMAQKQEDKSVNGVSSLRIIGLLQRAINEDRHINNEKKIVLILQLSTQEKILSRAINSSSLQINSDFPQLVEGMNFSYSPMVNTAIIIPENLRSDKEEVKEIEEKTEDNILAKHYFYKDLLESPGIEVIKQYMGQVEYAKKYKNRGVKIQKVGNEGGYEFTYHSNDKSEKNQTFYGFKINDTYYWHKYDQALHGAGAAQANKFINILNTQNNKCKNNLNSFIQAATIMGTSTSPNTVMKSSNVTVTAAVFNQTDNKQGGPTPDS